MNTDHTFPELTPLSPLFPREGSGSSFVVKFPLSVYLCLSVVALFFFSTPAAHAGIVSAQAVRAAVTEAVRSYARANGLDIEPDVPHARDVEVAGTAAPAVRASLAAKEVRGTSVPVRLEVMNGSGEIVRLMHFVARVRVFAEAAVASRDIARGDSLADGDIVMKRVEVGGVRGYYTSPDGLAGTRAKMSIREGTILRASNIRPCPLVHRGDRVTMKAVVGAIEVSSAGIARQDGGRGECIRVYNEMTRATVFCRILDSQTVQIGKGGG